MEPAEKEKKKIDVLLAEYQACHRNRDHYDSVRWTIGSIFIATSLTLFGISFLKEVRGNLMEVIFIAVFSVLLMLEKFSMLTNRAFTSELARILFKEQNHDLGKRR